MTLRDRARSIRHLDLSVAPGSVYAAHRRAAGDRRRITVQKLGVSPNVWKRGAA